MNAIKLKCKNHKLAKAHYMQFFKTQLMKCVCMHACKYITRLTLSQRKLKEAVFIRKLINHLTKLSSK